jgi:hypothetical protein
MHYICNRKNKIMQKILFLFIITTSLLSVGACKKKKKSGGTTPEAQLTIATNAGSNVQNPGGSFSFNTLITSAMPPSGVRIDVTVAEEVSGTNIPQVTGFTSSNSTIPTQLSNLPLQKWSVCSVKATSLSTTTNTATTSFRIIHK